jgi:HEAT repeat protein
VEYQDAPETVEQYSECALWQDEWNGRRHAEMQVFIPMKIRRREPEIKSRWRIRFHSMGQRKLSQLLALEHADSELQYAAAMRLVEMPDPSLIVILIDWFLKRRTRYALRVVSKIRDQRVLEALFEVFKSEAWNDQRLDTRFRRDLRVAIGAFGEEAVPKLAGLLDSEFASMQIAVLRALGETGSLDAGAIILRWLETHETKSYHQESVALAMLAKLRDLRALPYLANAIRTKPSLAIESLVLLNHPDAWKVLEDFVRSEANLHDGRFAAFHLSKINPAYLETYELLDRQASAHQLYLKTIRFIGSQKDIAGRLEALIAALSDPDPKRRVAAVSLICRHEEEFPEAPVVELLNDPEPEVRANSVYALGLRGSESDAPTIRRLTHDSSALVRYCAREALKRVLPAARRAGV